MPRSGLPPARILGASPKRVRGEGVRVSDVGGRLQRLQGEAERSERRLVTAVLGIGLFGTAIGVLRRLATGEEPASLAVLVRVVLALSMAAGLAEVLRRPDRVVPVRRIISAGCLAYLMAQLARTFLLSPSELGPPRGTELWLPLVHFLVYMNLPQPAALRTSLGLILLQVALALGGLAAGAVVTPVLETWMLHMLLSQMAMLLLLHFFTLRQEQLARTTAWVERLDELAHTDHLTGIPNRRSIEESLEREIARSERSGSPLAAVLLDLDRFKRVNDGLGHEAGDRVLEGVAGCLKGALRKGDLAGRFGGEEFLLLAADTDRAGGLAVAERILGRVREAELLPDRTVTASAGVAEHRPGESADDLLKRADAALYRAKIDGRDRAVAAP